MESVPVDPWQAKTREPETNGERGSRSGEQTRTFGENQNRREVYSKRAYAKRSERAHARRHQGGTFFRKGEPHMQIGGVIAEGPGYARVDGKDRLRSLNKQKRSRNLRPRYEKHCRAPGQKRM